MKAFPHYHQIDLMSCGPTCLRMVARYFGRAIDQRSVEALTRKSKRGVSLLAICDAAEALGLRTLPAICPLETIIAERRFPFIAHWTQNHFVVVYGIRRRGKGWSILVSDPAAPGLMSYTDDVFKRYWLSTSLDGQRAGVALFLEPTPEFAAAAENRSEKPNLAGFLFGYLRGNGQMLAQLGISLFAGNLLTLLVPILSAALVDDGVAGADLSFIDHLVLAQVLVFVGIAIVGLLRGWLLLHLSARMNLSLISDFLARMMLLPIAYFDAKNIGDILQRFDDHKRVEHFLSSRALDTLFSLFALVMYGCVLAAYSLSLLAFYSVGAVFYVCWVVGFLKFRRRIDHQLFNELARNRATEVHLVRGMPEIKLTGSELQKRWDWERIQVRLFKIGQRSLRIEQFQATGGLLIAQLITVLATYLAARNVVQGRMTLGEMVAVSMILGQISGPLAQLIDVLRDGQDALLSLERISEVHNAPPEEVADSLPAPTSGAITFTNVTFRYGGADDDPALDDVSLELPEGSTTAIVGRSGCGKTTLLKLLLRFYDPQAGEIKVGNVRLNRCSQRAWRDCCGAVMQDGYIFPDTIARNIAVTEEQIDLDRLYQAAEWANALGFVERLPLGFHTVVGDDGVALSAGQRQRLLIARALYKRPRILLLDEATSALDTENEAIITGNIAAASKNITTIIIAHRLSTVRNADQIIVLDRGRVVEQGNHASLTMRRGLYFELVRNQLELGA